MSKSKSAIRIEDYQPAVNWVKKFLWVTCGEHIERVHFDDGSGTWYFYMPDGTLLAHLEQEWMDRILLSLEGVEWLWADKIRSEGGTVYYVGRDGGDENDHNR